MSLSAKQSGQDLEEPMKNVQKLALLRYCSTMCLANAPHSLRTSARRRMRLFFRYLMAHLLVTQISHAEVPVIDNCHGEDPGQGETLVSLHMYQVKCNCFFVAKLQFVNQL